MADSPWDHFYRWREMGPPPAVPWSSPPLNGVVPGVSLFPQSSNFLHIEDSSGAVSVFFQGSLFPWHATSLVLQVYGFYGFLETLSSRTTFLAASAHINEMFTISTYCDFPWYSNFLCLFYYGHIHIWAIRKNHSEWNPKCGVNLLRLLHNKTRKNHSKTRVKLCLARSQSLVPQLLWRDKRA